MVKVLDVREAAPKEIVARLRRRGGFLSEKVRDAARRIINDVRDRGDEALLEYTKRFDGVRPDPIQVPPGEIRGARESLGTEAEESFGVAIENVRLFHEREMDRPWETSRDGEVREEIGHAEVVRVATKYPRTARRYFEGIGRQAEIIALHGSIELAPLVDLAECIVDLTATGTTLRENNLVILEEISTSTARLIANRGAYRLRNQEISALVDAMQKNEVPLG